MSPREEAPRAPYLLCAARVGDRRFGHRCRNGATILRDGYGVCFEHARAKRLRLALSAVEYRILAPMLGDQFSRRLDADGGDRWSAGESVEKLRSEYLRVGEALTQRGK
jgi:hypothetical protein